MMLEAACSLCNGRSWTKKIVEEDVVPYRCLCFRRRLALSYLGPELAKAPHRRSDLYRLEVDPESGEMIGDRTRDDLFIKGVWSEAIQHLRWAVGAKHHDDPSFTFKLVPDEMLLRVYLGDFAYGNRSSRVRDDIVTYNNLRDLIADCSLLIVRLGALAHNNRAAANVLLETLNIRASESKPTWLIEGTTFFGEGHKFYNDAVGSYIEENFEKIHVGGDVEAARKIEAQLQALRLEGVSFSVEESELPAQLETQERYVAEPGAWSNRAKKKKSKWGKPKKNGLEGYEI